MPNSSMLQVRTNPIDKEKASAILESLGTNLSTVVNMLIKQIIIRRYVLAIISIQSIKQSITR